MGPCLRELGRVNIRYIKRTKNYELIQKTIHQELGPSYNGLGRISLGWQPSHLDRDARDAF